MKKDADSFRMDASDQAFTGWGETPTRIAGRAADWSSAVNDNIVRFDEIGTPGGFTGNKAVEVRLVHDHADGAE